jgi:hypothetical protein
LLFVPDIVTADTRIVADEVCRLLALTLSETVFQVEVVIVLVAGQVEILLDLAFCGVSVFLLWPEIVVC